MFILEQKNTMSKEWMWLKNNLPPKKCRKTRKIAKKTENTATSSCDTTTFGPRENWATLFFCCRFIINSPISFFSPSDSFTSIITPCLPSMPSLVTPWRSFQGKTPPHVVENSPLIDLTCWERRFNGTACVFCIFFCMRWLFFFIEATAQAETKQLWLMTNKNANGGINLNGEEAWEQQLIQVRSPEINNCIVSEKKIQK